MKRPADPINRPGRFVEQQVINGVTRCALVPAIGARR